MNNSRDKFEAWAKPYYTEQQMSLNSAEHFARPNEYMMPHYQSAYEGWQAATEQSQKEIAELQAREKVLVEAIKNCLNWANGRQAEWGTRAEKSFEILEQALANVRGEL